MTLEIGDRLIFVGYHNVSQCVVVGIEQEGETYTIEWLSPNGKRLGEKQPIFLEEFVDDIKELGFFKLGKYLGEA